MSDYMLEATYRGAQLKLEIHESNGRASLIVNGIVRREEAGSKTLRLTATVQTDYEWHELVEGMVRFEPGKISATIFANNFEVAHRIFTRKGNMKLSKDFIDVGVQTNRREARCTRWMRNIAAYSRVVEVKDVHR